MLWFRVLVVLCLWLAAVMLPVFGLQGVARAVDFLRRTGVREEDLQRVEDELVGLARLGLMGASGLAVLALVWGVVMPAGGW